jgi:hypothetical protein
MTLLRAGSAALSRPALVLVLVVVARVCGVPVPVVDVVHMVLVTNGLMPAARPVGVRVLSMNIVLGGRHCSSLL